MSLNLSSSELQALVRQAVAAFPEECCGVLGGVAIGNDKRVTAILPLANARGDSRERRYFAPPEALRAAEDALRERQLEVLGYYHSHPNAPARPSQFDLDHATWPWLSYVIVSTGPEGGRELTSWTLADNRSRFEAEPIHVDGAAPRAVVPVAGVGEQPLENTG